jgi:hypothetical protein
VHRQSDLERRNLGGAADAPAADAEAADNGHRFRLPRNRRHQAKSRLNRFSQSQNRLWSKAE